MTELPRLSEWNAAQKAAREAALAEDGFVIVPVEPSEAMLDAGWFEVPMDATDKQDVANTWQAMIKAAPDQNG
jgi:hypothetical protein